MLLPILADKNDTVALNTAMQLGGLGDGAVPALQEALGSGNARLRRFAVFAMAKMSHNRYGGCAGAKAALPAILKLLADRDALVRRNAAEAVGLLGEAENTAGLLPLLQDNDTGVRFAARAALSWLGMDNEEAEKTVAAFDAELAKQNVSQPDPSPGTGGDPDEYLVGGPLTGLKLPLFAPQHGEPAGYPGCIPELAERAARENEAKIAAGDPDAEPFNENNAPFTTVGQKPEHELYPGAVEHWRAYGMKYEPVRSLYDRQSQVKNFVAPNISGAKQSQLREFAEPVHWVPRWGVYEPTGHKRKAVPVVELKAGDAPLVLDCGELAPSVYAVRVIAAVPTESLTDFRKNLLVKLAVDDGLNGERHEYVKRTPYTDNFYCVAEMFFHAPVKRAYRPEVSIADGSEIALLVHNISIDDCLAGHARRAIKTRTTLAGNRAALPALEQKRQTPGPIQKGGNQKQYLAEERLARDAWMWQSFPKDNAQAESHGGNGWPKAIKYGPPEDLTEYGQWKSTGSFWGRTQVGVPADPSLFLVNADLGLTYSYDDFNANRPLPEPYPCQDYGPGFIWQDQENENAGRFFAPIATQVAQFYKGTPRRAGYALQQWRKTGNDEFAHDAAVLLARWAWALPTLDQSTSYMHDGLAKRVLYGRTHRFYKRCTTLYGIYGWYAAHLEETEPVYDALFPYLSTSWELARSISRFVPWVKTPKEVVKFFDTYLVQEEAQRLSRYHWHNEDARHTLLAAVLGDNEFTKPWMDFVFRCSFVYPLPLAGLDEVAVTGCCREGTEYIASSFYAGGENFIRKPQTLQVYLDAGGLPEYSLDDPVRYPKAPAACEWLIERRVAGLNMLRIGDVTGPDKHYGLNWKQFADAGKHGWHWTKDPRFAFLLVHYFGQSGFSDEEWAKVQAAAATVSRAPWLTQPSRAMPNWATVLETGREHDDYRFRRAAAVRTGVGWGHHHNDSLDLQVYAHGTMATCDSGQRPGYCKPASRSTFMHNVVEIDGEWYGHAYTRALADAEGARYTSVVSYPSALQPQATLRDRQVALIDADAGLGAKPLSPAECKAGTKLETEGVVTPNSYVFDVFRSAGGKRHTYCFRANLSDEVTHNGLNGRPIDNDDGSWDYKYLKDLTGERSAADTPDHFVCTFRIHGKQIQADLGQNAIAGINDYFTRLHILGAEGTRALRGDENCHKWKYTVPMAFVQKRSPEIDNPDVKGNLESVFAAVIEPYVGQPFIDDIKRLTVKDNEDDARRAVALEVKTRSGHTDLCFADGRPDKVRTIGDVSVSGEFAHVSRDNKGLRQATLASGTLLRTEEVLLRPAQREYTGTVTAADYRAKTMTVEGDWPAVDGKRSVFTFEVGMADHLTTYTATAVKPQEGKAVFELKRGADFYLGSVLEIDDKTNTVYCNLSAGIGIEGTGLTPGMLRHWVASDDGATKFWRADYLGGSRADGKFGFRLEGPPAKMSDFGRLKKFRLWEYGVGDTVRHATSISLRRLEDGTFALEGDVAVTVGLKGRTLELTTDGGKTWTALKSQVADGLTTATVSAANLLGPAGARLRVR